MTKTHIYRAIRQGRCDVEGYPAQVVGGGTQLTWRVAGFTRATLTARPKEQWGARVRHGLIKRPTVPRRRWTGLFPSPKLEPYYEKAEMGRQFNGEMANQKKAVHHGDHTRRPLATIR